MYTHVISEYENFVSKINHKNTHMLYYISTSSQLADRVIVIIVQYQCLCFTRNVFIQFCPSLNAIFSQKSSVHS
jgi:uncharacterized membrane protein YqhA